MFRLIQFYYYGTKEVINGKTRLSDKYIKSIQFDTDKYSDTENNYYNVISDSLKEPAYSLTILKIGNKRQLRNKDE